MSHDISRELTVEYNIEQNITSLPGLDVLWSETTGDPSICVAVLDGPVDLSHSCFEGADLSVLDVHLSGQVVSGVALEHGTHVTSIIFAQHSGSVKGIAPGCKGLIVPVFADMGATASVSCSQSELAKAIKNAVQHGANIINISAGQRIAPLDRAESELVNAIDFCVANNVLVVAAAGNDGCGDNSNKQKCLHIPAALPKVLVVGAMNKQGTPLEFSNWGQAYQEQGILASGEDIIGAVPGVPGGSVALRSGTSYAAPIVSGIAALLLSIQLKYGDKPNPYAVREAILKSAYPCNDKITADCRPFLRGSLNVLEAYKLVKEKIKGEITNQNVEEVLVQETTDSSPEKSTGQVNKERREEMSDDVKEANKSRQESESAVLEKSVTSDVITTNKSGIVRSKQLSPSDCACGYAGVEKTLVYALGEIGYDFGSEARRDSIMQAMPKGKDNPNDPRQLLDHLRDEPWDATGIIWTLNVDVVPIYAIQPDGPYASSAFELLREFLADQISDDREKKIERISVPGIIIGQVLLLSGYSVPVIRPEIRGMKSWSTKALVGAVDGDKGKKTDKANREKKSRKITSFLNRIYYDRKLRNKGIAPNEQAINYAATNAWQIERVFEEAVGFDLDLDDIYVEPSPICRPDSDCWDARLVFFNPQDPRAYPVVTTYVFTIDVSDVVPVTVGEIRSWQELTSPIGKFLPLSR